MRRWAAGDWIEIDGIRLHVEIGAKKDGDLVLVAMVNGTRRRLSMALGAILADFFYENEEHLYPQIYGYLGGNKYLRYLRHAAIHGWEKAEAGLRAEKTRPQLWIEVGPDGEA